MKSNTKLTSCALKHIRKNALRKSFKKYHQNCKLKVLKVQVYKGKVCSVSVAGCSCVAPFISTERLFSILSVNVWEHAIASDILENNYTCTLMHCHSGRPDNISGIRDVSATGIFREIRGTRLTFLCKSREVFGYFDTTPESPPTPHTQPSKICSMRPSTQRRARQMLCWKNLQLEISWENHYYYYQSFLGLRTCYSFTCSFLA